MNYPPILLLFSILCTPFFSVFSQSVPVDISTDFKTVAKKIAKKEFKDFIHKSLEEHDLLLAATTRNIIDDIVNGENPTTIKEQVMEGIVDYGVLTVITSMVIKEFDDSRNTILMASSREVVSDAEYHRIISLAAIYLYEAVANQKLLPNTNELTKVLYSNEEYLSSIVIYNAPDYDSLYPVLAGLVPDYMDKIENLLDKATAFKSNIVRILRTGIVDSVTLASKLPDAPSDFNNQLSANQAWNKLLVDSILQHLNSFKNSYSSIVKYCLPYFRSVTNISEISIGLDSRIFVRRLVDEIYLHFADYSSTVPYKVGLQAAYYARGPEWLPDSVEYPRLSFRMNDRLQVSLCGSSGFQWFLYTGGFLDAVITGIFKSDKHRYLYCGTGISMGNISLSGSAGFPLNNKGKKTTAAVISLSYDIPVTELITYLTED
ncbi:MAG: hypothetical protein WCW40_06490 [Bacteroidota bacterium]